MRSIIFALIMGAVWFAGCGQALAGTTAAPLGFPDNPFVKALPRPEFVRGLLDQPVPPPSHMLAKAGEGLNRMYDMAQQFPLVRLAQTYYLGMFNLLRQVALPVLYNLLSYWKNLDLSPPHTENTPILEP